MRGAAEEQLAERQRLTVTSTDQRPLAMRSVHFPFDCDAFLEMIPKLNQKVDIVCIIYVKVSNQATSCVKKHISQPWLVQEPFFPQQNVCFLALF